MGRLYTLSDVRFVLPEATISCAGSDSTLCGKTPAVDYWQRNETRQPNQQEQRAA
jgi:hypothetical protein